MRVFPILFCLSACSSASSEPTEEKMVFPTYTQLPTTPPSSENSAYASAFKNPDACVPETFAADAIPYGFVFDLSCPPNIYDPPKWLPPWDIGPVIKQAQ